MNNNTQSKCSTLQMQIAMLSLTMTSIQTQIKQLETEFEQLKMDSKPTIADRTKTTDSSSDGYDTDEYEEAEPKAFILEHKGVSRHVMIPDYCESADLGKITASTPYVDSADSGSDSGYDSEDIPRIQMSPKFVPEEKRIDLFNLDLITEDWKARALLLEEI